jgi:carboxyl-terminal processing protease
MSWPRSAPRIAATAVITLGVFALGIWLGGHPSWLPQSFRDAFEQNTSGTLVNTVLDRIEQDYYRPVGRTQLVNKGLTSMVASLDDPYSHYYSPSAYRMFLNESNPHFAGIGVSVLPIKQGLRIIDVFPNSPAAKAGLLRADEIVQVNSTHLAGRSSQFASGLIRGKPGTTVGITVQRGSRTIHFSIVRARVVEPVASEQIENYHGLKIGDLSFTSFTSGSGDELRQQVHKALAHGAKALILDLRGNGGGLLKEAINVASIFVADGTIVTTKGRTQPTQVYTAEGNAIAPSIPMVVLVDHGTASSAEIVTGALSDHQRAEVVGTRTYGKGVFQEIQPMPGGGALDITVGEYFTPNGQNLGGGGVREGRGIKPSVYASTPLTSKTDTALNTAERVVASETKR